LTLFAAACFLLAAGKSFLVFAMLLGLSGIAIGVFKTGALASSAISRPRPGSTRRS
jgi:fucose permease